ncbi:DUF262 domain-containing protein [Chondromyces apiculatus]|uniref:DUF262 domain-containing protein n=1 Tax=Chondromyces apiculatus DSM 436 TaxID=1192034 RepID=A0A017SU55_9BACT|nr:DUF262 domain-containing protein [Chondromyces apiculatus]EYF00312.1 Hypothetical protein CAP_0964 [Chondromyces apiculatus DSM 436]
MATVFMPEHSPLDRIFAAKTTYRIPAYQRPYSWQAVGKSDQDSQVIQMWQDLWSFFGDNRNNTKEYFLGSMVIVDDPNKLRNFEVIDGQQRLTTLLLLFAAMRCFLVEVMDSSPAQSAEDGKRKLSERMSHRLEDFLYNETGPSMFAALKLKIERTVGTDYNKILERAVACQKDEVVAKLEKKHREIAQRYLKNRDYFMVQLRASFLAEGEVSLASLDIQKLDDFFVFLSTRVAIVQIKSSDFSTAYRIFEILNNRGLPLSNLDLLRNFVLERLAEAGIPNLDERWEHLESEYTFSEDFVGRWAESLNAAQPQASAFSEVQRIFERRYQDSLEEKKIEIFYRDLERNLFWYNLITEEEERIEDVGIRNAITFIKLLGNDRYSIDLLLALFRSRNYEGGADEEIAQFLRVYRTHALHVFLLGRFSSSTIYEAIKALNKGELAKARQSFALTDAEKQVLASFFEGRIPRNEPAKLLLAACVWEDARDERQRDVVEQHLSYDKATLEHVIPQNPAPNTNWLSDFDAAFRADFTHRLGNMTLLTHAKNSANKNFDFARKKQVYEQTRLPMTFELSQQPLLTQAYLEARHQRIVAKLRSIFLG